MGRRATGIADTNANEQRRRDGSAWMSGKPFGLPPLPMLRRARYGLCVVAAFSAMINLLILVSPLYMLQVYDRVLTSFRVETLLYLSLIAVISIMTLGVFDVLRGVAVSRLGRWWDETVRPALFAAALSRAQRHGPQVGAVLNDLQTVRGFVGSANIMPFFDAPWTPLFLGLIFLLHPVLGMLAVASGLTLLALAVIGDRLARAAQKGVAAEVAASNAFCTAALRNADVVYAMGMGTTVSRLYQNRQHKLNVAGAAGGERSAIITGVSRTIRIGVQIAVLGLGAWLVLNRELTGGGMIAASIILGRALAPIEQGMGSWRAFIAAREAQGRISALMRDEPHDAPDPVALPAPTGQLTVENLTMVFPGQDKPVLRRVTFRLDAGQVLAVIGPSAAGKSALCRLMVGTWRPTGGHIRLDDAELGAWREADRAKYIGYLPQAIELFGGTVRQNIARLGHAEDSAIIAAAQMAGCHETILRLPRGYDTEIGEGGCYLSGGQRQRIALARGLFGDPRLIVLDEPNANLDQDGEAALLAAIAKVRNAGATVVLVNHRHTMMQAVDKIAILRDGILENFGARDSVLAQMQAASQKHIKLVEPQHG